MDLKMFWPWSKFNMHDGVNVQKTFNHSIMQFSICYNLNIIHVELSCFLKGVCKTWKSRIHGRIAPNEVVDIRYITYK